MSRKGSTLERLAHARRWKTALLLISVVIPAIVWGGPWIFLVLVGIAVAFCQWELLGLSGQALGNWERLLVVFLALPIPAASAVWGERGLLMALTGCLMLWMALETARRGDLRGVLGDLGLRMFGYLYAGLLPSYFVLLRKLPHGVHWILLTMTITAVGDTAAYYMGRLMGRHKLMPRVSPNKTVEGAIAGLLGNMVGALAYGLVFFPSQVSQSGMALALLVGGTGQLGDLGESMLKRAVGLKDSSAILPGHGGVLDRLDSLLFSAPVVYYWVTA